MNRNAARHLALVVSILLCFFVYMGYRFWGNAGREAPPEPASSDFSFLESTPWDDELPVADDAEGELLALAVPGSATDVSIPLGQEGASGLSLPIPASVAPPPSGSIEENTAVSTDFPGFFADTSGSGTSVPSDGLDRAGDRSDSPRAATAPGSPSSLKPPENGLLAPPSSSGDGDAELGWMESPPPPVRQPAATRPSPASPATTAAVPPSPTANSSPPVSPVRPDTAPNEVGGPAPVRQPGEQAADDGFFTASESLRIYVIQPGDTLNRIAARELGSVSLADNIFLLNRDVISDPDHLLIGLRIRLPIREQLGQVGGEGTRLARTHRVQRGDTLSSIASRYYGSSAAWQFIYETNRGVMANPNQLTVGMELLIPPYDGE